jgi:ATP-dependent DNA ligase
VRKSTPLRPLQPSKYDTLTGQVRDLGQVRSRRRIGHDPGGMALRFARVVRYRDDKGADEADTIDTVRALFEPARR